MCVAYVCVSVCGVYGVRVGLCDVCLFLWCVCVFVVSMLCVVRVWCVVRCVYGVCVCVVCVCVVSVWCVEFVVW